MARYTWCSTSMVMRCLVSLSHRTTSRGLSFAGAHRLRGGGGRCLTEAYHAHPASSALMATFSIETTPKLSSRIETHCAILPPGTPVYVAAIPGTALKVYGPLPPRVCRRVSRISAPSLCLVRVCAFFPSSVLDEGKKAQTRTTGSTDVLGPE